VEFKKWRGKKDLAKLGFRMKLLQRGFMSKVEHNALRDMHRTPLSAKQLSLILVQSKDDLLQSSITQILA